MSIFRLFSLKSMMLLLPTLIVAASVYAFAAANVVPESGAGDGSGAISGYTASNITYDTNDDGDPSTLDDVTFDLDATAGAGTPTEVFVQVDSTSSDWFTCTAGVDPSWSCAISTITSTLTADADTLNVVAAE